MYTKRESDSSCIQRERERWFEPIMGRGAGGGDTHGGRGWRGYRYKHPKRRKVHMNTVSISWMP